MRGLAAIKLRGTWINLGLIPNHAARSLNNTDYQRRSASGAGFGGACIVSSTNWPRAMSNVCSWH